MVLKNNKNISAVKCGPEITKREQKDEYFLISTVLKYCLIPRTAKNL